MTKRLRRTAFFISDGTGITAETLGKSLLSQFEEIEFDKITLPYIDSKEKARQAVKQVNQYYSEEATRPVIFNSIVNQEIRSVLTSSKAFIMDIFTMFLNPLEAEFGMQSSYTVGKSHAIIDDQKYKIRMDAVQFALDNDDGACIRHFDYADVVLVGVSRSGKTPTCVYLALQYGIRAANYPLTEEDLESGSLPTVLKPYRDKLFGLTIDPERLSAIRQARKANSRYASLTQCELETSVVETLFKHEDIPYMSSTHASIEEISTRLLSRGILKRRI